MIKLQYMIKNKRNVYIRLDGNGRAVTCFEKQRGEFEYSKACNIVKALPKHLKKMGFKVEGIPDIPVPVTENAKVIESDHYEPSDNVLRWVDKIGVASDILNEAIDRNEDLKQQLDNINKKRTDLLHEIELKSSFDMYSAWKMLKKLQKNAAERRDIKDEMLILSNIIRSFDSEQISRKRISHNIEGLKKRKYTYRIVEVDEDEEGNEVVENEVE